MGFSQTKGLTCESHVPSNKSFCWFNSSGSTFYKVLTTAIKSLNRKDWRYLKKRNTFLTKSFVKCIYTPERIECNFSYLVEEISFSIEIMKMGIWYTDKKNYISITLGYQKIRWRSWKVLQKKFYYLFLRKVLEDQPCTISLSFNIGQQICDVTSSNSFNASQTAKIL